VAGVREPIGPSVNGSIELNSWYDINIQVAGRITDKGRIEHFFTTDFERRDRQTIVTITNSPKIVASVKAGDRI
jgi:uncharacterized protein YegJ (DUF2314 family)